ncbi:hypothetical protein OS493_001989 [Desmophyllum pertusum]|uniref:ZP domain-containing protein n=2 Tax=Desmophyllum pertusum TaxID=174260 RepID=A0A9W9Z6C8_9CNID|nr:hypothetical protein OS493_001989 [Desmophyllum pertusum]
MKGVFLLFSCLVLAAARKADLTYEDPTEVIIDGVPVGDKLLDETAKDQPLYDNNKFIINGETVGPRNARNAVPRAKIDETEDEPAQDEAHYGWTKHPFSWCTVNGRSLIYRSTKSLINLRECQLRCEAMHNGSCRAIEFWEKYNNACYVCKDMRRITPYTNEADLAYPVHVWVQNEGPSPTPPPPQPEVNVTCSKNEMSISIPKQLLRGLDREHLRLTDLNCPATETPTHFILRTDLTECRTKSRHTKDFVIYMNKVEEIPLLPGQIITRVREVEIPFSCYYSNTGVVSAVGLEVKSKKIVFSKKGRGEFVLEMKIFPNNNFRDQYKKKDFPVQVTLREILFVEVSVDTEDGRLTILAEDCFATPDPNPDKSGLSYTFIKDGCLIDDTMRPISTDDQRSQRFSMEAFSFIGDHQFVYLHCRIKVCNATDLNSRCAQGCLSHRRRRSLYTQETNDEEYYLAKGPFMRSDDEDDEADLQETLTGMRDVEKSGQNTSLIAAMAVVAAVCLVGVSYFAWDKKKRSAVRSYQLLSVPTED